MIKLTSLFQFLDKLQQRCKLQHIIIRYKIFTSTCIASTQVQSSEWPDDGLGLGSYPKLPDISAQTKEPFGWWDIQERRNFGDTVSQQGTSTLSVLNCSSLRSSKDNILLMQC